MPLSLRLTTGFVILMIGSLLLGEVIGFHSENLAGLITAITLLGLSISLFIIFRSHNQIDLVSIAPALLRSTLDALTEGVVLIDKNERIIIANTTFANIVGTTAAKLKGVPLSIFSWQQDEDQHSDLPWSIACRNGTQLTDSRLQLVDFNNETRVFSVDCAPAKDSNGRHSGTMICFDDVTRRQEKNKQLEGMLGMLQKSQDEITRQNVVLQELATRDSLTNCLNRRSFYERFEAAFRGTQINENPMSCIMADIDLFKSINDRFGHTAGDQVICRVAETLQHSLRTTDTVCRYGGEEFCVILPGIGLDQAIEMSERARINIAQLTFDENGNDRRLSITSSFGVSSVEHQPEGFSDLIDRADKALYHSKDAGRNRVTAWKPEIFSSNEITSKDDSDTGATKSEEESSSFHQHNNTPANDILTGLLNRKAFHDNIASTIETCQTTQQHASVIILDLDMFRQINSNLGYTVGDELLRVVSQRIVDALRSTDAVARVNDANGITSIYRLGGDEFGILLTALDCAEVTDTILKRIMSTISAQTSIQGHDICLSCSAGISIYPDDGANADTLLKHASTALYHAKLHENTRFKFFNEGLDRNSLERLKLENDLRTALDNDELEVFYQPKLNLDTGKINAVEALARWRHPELGMIPPAEFIPLAESCGMIDLLGDRVLETACRQLKHWQRSGQEELVVTVNLSATQFRQGDFLEKIQHAIEATGIAAHHLELELTESVIMDDIDNASSTMRALHCSGVRLSIDDFGTGYSSLSQLKRFPINTIKIDRSFIRDVTTDTDAASIVSAIIAMAHNMGLNVVAEGVESKDQLEYLASLGCDEAQGFLFSPPVPHHEASRLIGENIDSLISPVTAHYSGSQTHI